MSKAPHDLKVFEPDFKKLFESAPGPYLVLLPDAPKYTMVAMSDEYIRQRMRERGDLLGRGLFEAFFEDPDDAAATGARNLRASFDRVVLQQIPDPMVVQRYDIRRPKAEGGGYKEKYWSAINSPLFDSSGKLLYIIHRVEDVTEYIKLKQLGSEQIRLNDEMKIKMESEIFARSQEVNEANLKLRHAQGVLQLKEQELSRLNEELKAQDRMKTQFFANISHEFRTPLTLMLGPLEDSLSDQTHPLQPEQRERQEMIHRNALRLFKLVNSLLDFSRIEAGRMQAVYEPTDLAKLTKELASHFESVMHKAGLKFTITAPALGDPVFVDREMWEKIVLNLLSNAFKFTFTGEIALNLKTVGDHVELLVKDTGVGIPEKELHNIFKRFYRIEGSRGRTFEGTGIGLALIQELVKMHGGTISVSSKIDEGSAFTVKIPLGSAHLSADHLGETRQARFPEIRAETIANEALSLLPNEMPTDTVRTKMSAIPGDQLNVRSCRILLADDNADMRSYLESLLKPFWGVTSVSDGQEAYDEIVRAGGNGGYDIVLSDVMMPRLDGFGLVKKLRENPATKTISIILISARAGEEARVTGVQSGADDYLIKPFSGKELVARVRTHLELKRLRDERQTLTEDKLKMALASAVAGAWDWDIKANRVHWDEVTQRLLGFRPGTLPGTFEAFLDTLHSDDRQKTLGLVEESIKNRSYYSAEFRVLWPDGSLHWIQASGRPSYDDKNTPSRMLGIVIEITKHKEDEETLRGAIRARDEFLIIASHELKTPITSLKMQLQITRRGVNPAKGLTPPIDQLAKAIDVSIIQVDRLTKLIEGMLDISRIQAGQLKIEIGTVNLADLVREVVDRFSAELSALKCPVEIQIPADIESQWDKARIEQVLINLISNAMKYAPGSKIKITAAQVVSNVTLTFRDTGPGIPKEKQSLIFKRFGRAHSYQNIAGFGLGLYISREIIKAHGGTMSVQSDEGEGTALNIEIPLVIHESRTQKECVGSSPSGKVLEGDSL